MGLELIALCLGWAARFFRRAVVELLHIKGLRPLGRLNEVEQNFVALIQNAVALAFDGREVNKDIPFTLGADESVSLVLVKPFYGAV